MVTIHKSTSSYSTLDDTTFPLHQLTTKIYHTDKNPTNKQQMLLKKTDIH